MENSKTNRSFSLAKFYGKYGTLMILVVIFAFASIVNRTFLTVDNLTNVMRQIAVVTILSLGATFVITLGHTNIGYGSEVALLGCICCQVVVATNSLLLGILVAVVLGMAIGALNGVIITRFGIPAFIMTLAVHTIARGAALLITGGNNIKGMRASFAFLGQGNAGPIPISVILLLVLFFISYIILNKTPFGRHVYAVGGNIHAAEASGINTKNVQIKAFIYDGLMTAIASVVFMSRLNTGIPAAAEGYEFDAITAVVVGGTSLAGGSGSIVGTVLGAVIVGIINNVQILMGVHTNWQKVVKGIVILLAVIVDILTKRASAKQK